MPIIVRFTYSPQLLYRGQSAMARSIKWFRWAGVFLVVVFPLLMIGFALANGQSLRSAIVSNVPWIVGAPVFWLIVIPLLRRWSARRTFRATPALQGEQVYTFGEDDIIAEAGLSHGTTSWKAIVRSVEARELFLLFLSNQMAYVIPKEAFASDADLERFRELLAAKVARFGKRTPTLSPAAT